ncbi:hypothetical protein [Nocardia salmonicida]
MTSAGWELSVSPDKIKSHATNVTSARSGLSEALEAAPVVSAPSDAFTTRDTTNAAALKNLEV